MKVAAALRHAAERLAPSDTARLDAELLMAHALGTTRSELLLRRCDAPAPAGYATLVARREAGEPIAYITGRAEFYGLPIAVTPAVLIPRADSETLIDAARTRLASPPARVLDLGTGSGALLLAALSVWREAEGIGIDASGPALSVAKRNAEALDMTSRTSFEQRDWARPRWTEGLGRFDLILANPPYVEQDAALAPDVRDHEPAGALFAGPDGLDAYRILLPMLVGLLEEGGVALVEIGHVQHAAVRRLADAAGLGAVLHRDLAGRPRALALASHRA